MSPELCSKVSLMIALAPTCKPNGFDNRFVDSLAKTSSTLVYGILGRKALLSSTLFWQRVLPPSLHVAAIDYAVKMLFGWSTENISMRDKPGFYSHIYSYSRYVCVCVVHCIVVRVTSSC
jgi:lysosomal acid lipase/cholesteryl ester hydrolase